MPESAKTIAEAGLERVREILFGEILVELERRLAKLDTYISTRSNDVEHGARQRTDVLEAHQKKEIAAMVARAQRDTTELRGEIRELRHEQQAALAQIEQRIARLEEHLEAQIARIERDNREQLLAATKTLFEEVIQLRSQWRTAVAHEDEVVEAEEGEGSEHATGAAH